MGKSQANTLFGNPAILWFRTRGFASPDFAGFALIGDYLFVCVISFFQLRTILPEIQFVNSSLV